MYAVIATGGKQERVEVGSFVEVERLGAVAGDEVTFAPVLLVEGAEVIAAPGSLEGASVTGRVVGETKGPKIIGFTYKAKARGRRRFGHRQHYTRVEITAIAAPSSAEKSPAGGRASRTGA